MVLDIDPYKRGGESLEKLRGLVGGADLLTSTALTSRGGRHLYYRSGANTYATRRNWPFPGIDTIGQGLAVVAPPSVHALGDVYAWAPGLDPWTTPPRELPPALAAIIGKEPGRLWKTAALRYSLPNLNLRRRLRRV